MPSLRNGLLFFLVLALILYPLPIWIDLIRGNQIPTNSLFALLLTIAIVIVGGMVMMMQVNVIERIEKRQWNG